MLENFRHLWQHLAVGVWKDADLPHWTEFRHPAFDSIVISFSPLQWIDQILIKAATQQSLNGRNFRMLGKNEGQIHFQSYSSIQDPHWALSYSPFPFRASTTTSCVTGQIVQIECESKTVSWQNCLVLNTIAVNDPGNQIAKRRRPILHRWRAQ